MENKYKKILAKIAAVISIVAVFSCGVVNISYANNTTYVDDEFIGSLELMLKDQEDEDLKEAANDEHSDSHPNIPLEDVENITPYNDDFRDQLLSARDEFMKAKDKFVDDESSYDNKIKYIESVVKLNEVGISAPDDIPIAYYKLYALEKKRAYEAIKTTGSAEEIHKASVDYNNAANLLNKMTYKERKAVINDAKQYNEGVREEYLALKREVAAYDDSFDTKFKIYIDAIDSNRIDNSNASQEALEGARGVLRSALNENYSADKLVAFEAKYLSHTNSNQDRKTLRGLHKEAKGHVATSISEKNKAADKVFDGVLNKNRAVLVSHQSPKENFDKAIEEANIAIQKLSPEKQVAAKDQLQIFTNDRETAAQGAKTNYESKLVGFRNVLNESHTAQEIENQKTELRNAYNLLTEEDKKAAYSPEDIMSDFDAKNARQHIDKLLNDKVLDNPDEKNIKKYEASIESAKDSLPEEERGEIMKKLTTLQDQRKKAASDDVNEKLQQAQKDITAGDLNGANLTLETLEGRDLTKLSDEDKETATKKIQELQTQLKTKVEQQKARDNFDSMLATKTEDLTSIDLITFRGRLNDSYGSLSKQDVYTSQYTDVVNKLNTQIKNKLQEEIRSLETQINGIEPRGFFEFLPFEHRSDALQRRANLLKEKEQKEKLLKDPLYNAAISPTIVQSTGNQGAQGGGTKEVDSQDSPAQTTRGPTQGSQTTQNTEDQEYRNGIDALRETLKKNAYLKGSVDAAIEHAEKHQAGNIGDAYNDYYQNSGAIGYFTAFTKEDYLKIYYEVDRLKGGNRKPTTAAGVSNTLTPQTSNPGNPGGKPTSAPEPVDPIRAEITELENHISQMKAERTNVGNWLGELFFAYTPEQRAKIDQLNKLIEVEEKRVKVLQAQLNNPSIKGPTMSTKIITDEHGNYVHVRRNKNKVHNVPYDRNKTMEKSNFPEHDEEDDNKGSMTHSSQALSE